MMTMTTSRSPRDSAAPAPPASGSTIVEVFKETARTHPTRPALRWREGAAWRSLSWGQYEQSVTGVANALRNWGLLPGERVGILATNRPQWHIADIATMAAGLVSVPVYPSNAASQVRYVLGHSGARVCFVENVDQLAKVLLHRGELPELEHVVVMDDVDGLDDGFITCFDDLCASVASGGSAADTLDELVQAVSPGALATLVYTSGTTGPPKGAMITHANVMATMRSLTSLIGLRSDDRFLSFLPLSHITERSISHFGQIVGGSETWFARSIATLADDLQACRPTILFAVPRVWEKFRDSILEHVRTQRRPGRDLADRYISGADVATRSSRFLDHLVGRRIRRQLGVDQCRVVACGAAPVHPDLLRWFHGIGIPIAEGYGQTEVSLCTSTNTPGDTVIGTVGRPIPGMNVAIAPDGEILVKGDNVCAGYWRDEAATRALIDAAGWMHTGDLGRLDEGGYLHVTGRKKDLIITAYGKNVSPEEIETGLRIEPLIGQAVVIGNDRPYLTALLTIDADAAAEWAAERGRSLDFEALTEDRDLHAELSRAIERVNASHSHAERVRRWRVLPRDLTVSGGELTPTLKVKRHLVAQRWADVIDEMYAAP